MIVKISNIVPNGVIKHSIQAVTKLNQYLFLFAKNRPEVIKQTKRVNPISKIIKPVIKIGEFNHYWEAEASKNGYIQDLKEEKAQIVDVGIGKYEPEETTVSVVIEPKSIRM